MEMIQWFIEALKKHWTLEVRAILGPPGTPGTVQEARLLNRIITWDSEGILWEPDARHVDVILERMGVTNTGTTPLVKEKAGDEEEESEEPAGI